MEGYNNLSTLTHCSAKFLLKEAGVNISEELNSTLYPCWNAFPYIESVLEKKTTKHPITYIITKELLTDALVIFLVIYCIIHSISKG